MIDPITVFAKTNFRNEGQRFGIKQDDRRRHMYIIGKTGMGKSVLLENMVYSDVINGSGVCYVDPHGDTAEKIIDCIPLYVFPGSRARIGIVWRYQDLIHSKQRRIWW